MPSQLLGDISLNGIPGAASGTVRFYQPTTLIPVVVYSNDAATSAITQPIALDANGRSGTPIYVTKMVRMIVYDANGAQLQDVERADGLRAENVSLVNTSWPLAASEDAAWTQLATSLGGTNGNFKANAPGASTRSAQAKLSEQVSVKDFGAIGNGVADDTGAFNSAVAYAVILGGAIVAVPAGTYLISSPITISGNGISFKGSGSLASIVKNSSATTDALNITGSRLFIEDIGISASTASTGSGVVFGSAASYVTLSRLRITGHKYGALDTASNVRILIRDCEIVTSGVANGAAIRLAAGTVTTGVGPLASVITGCTLSAGLSGGSTSGIFLSGGPAANKARLNSITGNYTYTTDNGIFIDQATSTSMIGNAYESDVGVTYASSSATTDVTDVGNLSGAGTLSDASTGQSSTYASPRTGKWSSGFVGLRTTVGTTSAYTVTNSQFNFHHVVGTAAGITITISTPTAAPDKKGATILFFFENTSGGAVTWTLSAGYRGASVAPATGTGIGVLYAYSTDLAKWVEVNRGSAV